MKFLLPTPLDPFDFHLAVVLVVAVAIVANLRERLLVRRAVHTIRRGRQR